MPTDFEWHKGDGVICRHGRDREEGGIKKAMNKLLDLMEMFVILILVMALQVLDMSKLIKLYTVTCTVYTKNTF